MRPRNKREKAEKYHFESSSRARSLRGKKETASTFTWGSISGTSVKSRFLAGGGKGSCRPDMKKSSELEEGEEKETGC